MQVVHLAGMYAHLGSVALSGFTADVGQNPSTTSVLGLRTREYPK